MSAGVSERCDAGQLHVAQSVEFGGHRPKRVHPTAGEEDSEADVGRRVIESIRLIVQKRAVFNPDLHAWPPIASHNGDRAAVDYVPSPAEHRAGTFIGKRVSSVERLAGPLAGHARATASAPRYSGNAPTFGVLCDAWTMTCGTRSTLQPRPGCST
jgi:hypothetical protein